jgi:hypothetical protein
MYAIRVTCWMALMGSVALGQNDAATSATLALRRGPLTIWVVSQASKRNVPVPVHRTTAADYSRSLDSISYGANPNPQAVKEVQEERDPLRDRLRGDLNQSFPHLNADVTTIAADELQDKLATAEGTPAFPDVIVGSPLPIQWPRLATDAGIVMLGSPGTIAQENNTYIDPTLATETAILLNAPHPGAARAFVIWQREGQRLPPRVEMKGEWEEPVNVAVRAVGDLINGSEVADKDPETAEFSSGLARALALGAVQTVPDDLGFHTDVLRATANERLAVVSLRVVAASDKSFGVVHPLVVLKKAADGRWKILQISANLAFNLQTGAFRWLNEYALPTKSKQLKPVVGISQAAPVDGDYRPPKPELWWDNSGDGSLLIVEWQRQMGSGWTDTRMFFISDRAWRLKTRVTAEFANTSGVYRWRVWTVGEGGVLTLSPWRTVTIGSQ